MESEDEGSGEEEDEEEDEDDKDWAWTWAVEHFHLIKFGSGNFRGAGIRQDLWDWVEDPYMSDGEQRRC
eukprot:737894-Heterocapsa_arctica.AAC.1